MAVSAVRLERIQPTGHITNEIATVIDLFASGLFGLQYDFRSWLILVD